MSKAIEDLTSQEQATFRSEIGAMANTPAALVTAAQAMDAAQEDDMREAIKAISSDVLFFDDFGRYANGTVIGNGSTSPVIGEVYNQSWNGPSGASMFVENRALRCPVDSNNYLGFSVPNYNGELDICLEIESRNPSGFYNANGTGFTLAFKESQIVVSDGSGIAVSGAMHLNIASTGVTDASHFQQPTSPAFIGTGSPNNAWGEQKGLNAIWRCRVWAKGNALEISAFGKTLRWEGPQIAGRLAGQRIWFYFQLNNVTFAGLPTPAERTYALLRRIWAGSPASSIAASFAGEGSSAFEGNAPASYPNTITVSPGGRPVSGHAGSTFLGENPAFRVFGTPASNASNQYTGTAAYFEGFVNMTPPTGGINPYRPVISPRTLLTAKVATAANASLANIRGLHRQTNLPPGMTEYQRIAGTFGANGNTKQIQVREAGGVAFDSGATSQNGGVWTLEITRQSITGTSEIFMFEFWSAATGILKSVTEVNRGTTFTTFSLHASGVAAGDVTIFHHTLYCSQ